MDSVQLLKDYLEKEDYIMEMRDAIKRDMFKRHQQELDEYCCNPARETFRQIIEQLDAISSYDTSIEQTSIADMCLNIKDALREYKDIYGYMCFCSGIDEAVTYPNTIRYVW